MIQYVDEHFVANEVCMLRDEFRGSVLIVEGSDDAMFFERFAARKEECRIVVANGKSVAIASLSILRDRGFGTRVLVAVDADFCHITGDEPSDADIVVTDFHDLEIQLINSNALDDLLREHATSANLQRAEGTWGRTLRERLFQEAAKIGQLRYVNERESLSLSFKSVDLYHHVDTHSLEVDIENFLSELLDVSNSPVSRREVEEMVKSLSLPPHHETQICRGHDCTVLLSVAVCDCIGHARGAVLNDVEIESLLRLAFDSSCFALTELYASITRWEDRNNATILAV